MTTPRFDDTAEISLTSDDAVLERVRDLVEGAYRQQLWLMFLDDEARQLPVVIPHDVPDAPSAEARRDFPGFVRELVAELGAGAVVLTLERFGTDDLRPGDREWFAVVAAACRAADVRLRSPILCSDDGFRWIASEDYLEPPK